MVSFFQEKKQQKLILILVAVVVAIFITVYFGLIRQKSNIPATEPIAGDIAPAGGQVVVRDEKIDDIDFLFLQDSRFLELKKYGEWPIEPRETGRENPFEPFNGYSKDKPIEENIEEIIEEETLEEEIPEEAILKEDLEMEEPETEEESIEKATIEELLRLLNGGEESL